MLGLPRLQQNNFLLHSVIYFCLLVWLSLTGCKASKEINGNNSNNTIKKDFIYKYERTFNPSEYDLDVSIVKRIENDQRLDSEIKSLLIPAIPETISGFRIQLFFTQEIEEANKLKDSIEQQLSDVWSYVVYDLPYYKVRVGDFVDRSSANVMLRKILSIGYKDAWIVPDNVFKNPPPKPQSMMLEPENPLKRNY